MLDKADLLVRPMQPGLSPLGAPRLFHRPFQGSRLLRNLSYGSAEDGCTLG